jgi:hypothetical protein
MGDMAGRKAIGGVDAANELPNDFCDGVPNPGRESNEGWAAGVIGVPVGDAYGLWRTRAGEAHFGEATVGEANEEADMGQELISGRILSPQ